jgi:ribosomal protein L37E
MTLYRRRTACAGCGFVALILTLGVLASPAGARTYLNYGDGQVRYKPHRLVAAGSGVACGVWSAKRLRWRHWGKRAARATGTLVYNPGEGGCAASPLRSVRAL